LNGERHLHRAAFGAVQVSNLPLNKRIFIEAATLIGDCFAEKPPLAMTQGIKQKSRLAPRSLKESEGIDYAVFTKVRMHLVQSVFWVLVPFS
jgi:hypothetical protein